MAKTDMVSEWNKWANGMTDSRAQANLDAAKAASAKWARKYCAAVGKSEADCNEIKGRFERGLSRTRGTDVVTELKAAASNDRYGKGLDKPFIR